jgi:serine/threonine protein kinase/tetratricopeptide (TPR) repeat protein
MTPERWNRVSAIFERAVACHPQDRRHVVDEACNGDLALHAEIIALLANDRADEFLEPINTSRLSAPLDSESDPLVGLRVGRYEITRRIGEGGMGNVYLGVRTEDYTSQVAIKVVRRGMDSELVLSRFHDEMQFQAALGKHRNIARMVDAGETDEGLPYYVMEYVEGERIDRWCDRHRLPVRRRLELFRDVCAAVQFAHQNTVLHRDLKPSNILVTEDGRPILIDFGIAKLLDDAADASKPERTLTGMQVLTPEYASPEQVRGGRLTTASDVYSLGVVLYELLTGQRPYRLDTRTPLQMAQVVSQAAPVRPSEAVARQEAVGTTRGTVETDTAAHIALARDTAPGRLSRALRGDLDRIVLRALHKEPDRRYASAEQLSADIDRHLRGLPVLAHTDSLWYHCSKFIRRNRTAAALAGLMIASLIAGIVGTSSQMFRAEEARLVARREAETAKDVLEFFVLDMIAAADPAADGHDVTVFELLNKAEAKIDDRFAGRLDIQATLRHVLARTYASLGLTREALDQFQRGYDIRRELLGSDHRDTLESMIGLGAALDEVGRLEDAESLLNDAVHRGRRVLGDDDPLTLEAQATLGETLQTLRRYDQAEPLLRQTLRVQQRILPDGDEQILTTMSSLAVCLRVQGKLQEAEVASKDFFELARRVKGPTHPATMSAMNGLGLLLFDRQKWEEALTVQQELLAIGERDLPPGHFFVAVFRGNVADCLVKLGRDREAEQLLLASYEGLRSSLGPDRNLTERRLDRVYRFYYKSGRLEEADRFHREAVYLRLRVAGAGESESVLRSLDEFVEFAESHGTFTGAERFYRDLIAYADSLPSDYAHRPQYLGNLGWALLQKKQYELAEPLLLASYEERKATPDTNPGDLKWLLETLVSLYTTTGRAANAARYQHALASLPQ